MNFWGGLLLAKAQVRLKIDPDLLAQEVIAGKIPERSQSSVVEIQAVLVALRPKG